MLGLLRLLGAIAATSADCLNLLGGNLAELCDLCLVSDETAVMAVTAVGKEGDPTAKASGSAEATTTTTTTTIAKGEASASGKSTSEPGHAATGGTGGVSSRRPRAQPPTAVRHACLSMLLAAVRHPPSLHTLLPVLFRVHVAQSHSEWAVTPAGDTRASHAGLVNLGATCYMNATLQQLFAVPAFRDGLLAAAPPPTQRSELFTELQRCICSAVELATFASTRSSEKKSVSHLRIRPLRC